MGPFSGRQVIAILGTVVVVALVIQVGTTPLGTAGATPPPPNPETTAFIVGEVQEGLRPGDRAPELATTRADGSPFVLTDLDGRPVSLAALRGKAVWIDFWASWCPPCQAETPVIRETYAAYRDRGLEVVAISVQETTADDVRRYAERYGLEHTVAADLTAEIFRLYRVYALPTQFFIDPNGIVRHVVQGPVTRESAAAYVESILPAQ